MHEDVNNNGEVMVRLETNSKPEKCSDRLKIVVTGSISFLFYFIWNAFTTSCAVTINIPYSSWCLPFN